MDEQHPRVLVTRHLPGDALERLGRKAEVDLNGKDCPFSRDELLARITPADGLISTLSDTVDGNLLAAAPRLRVVANYAVGLNNVDLAAARDRGVWVTNTPGVLTDATADLTMALLLAVARRLNEGERLVRGGTWAGWSPSQLLGRGLGGKRLGLVGFGRIGQAVARRSVAFGLEVVYFDERRLPTSREQRLFVRYLPLEDLLATSDFVSLHVPLSPETRGLIGTPELDRMKPGAILINTARGEVVDQTALVEALSSGRLGGAGLDVYDGEPDIPAALLGMNERLVLLPHVGSATWEARTAMADMVVDDVLEALSGQRPDRSAT